MKSAETIALGSFAVALVTSTITVGSLTKPGPSDPPSPVTQVNHAAHHGG